MTINNNASSSTGIGFFGALTILFIALKLLGAITWSWIWVLAPLWIPFILIFVIFGIVALVAAGR